MLGGWAVTHAGCLGHASFTPIPHPPSSPCPPSPLTCSRSLCQRQATSATGRGTLPSCARSACPTCSVHGPWRPGSVGRGGAGGGTASSSLSMAWLQQGRVEAVKQVEQQRASRHEEQTRSSVSASGQAVIGLLSSTTGLPPAPPPGTFQQLALPRSLSTVCQASTQAANHWLPTTQVCPTAHHMCLNKQQHAANLAACQCT